MSVRREQRGRWPASVFDHGVDPDPRFSLANERTFLAWVRTSLALLAGAAALEALPLPLNDTVQYLLATVLAVGGLAVAVMAWRGWVRTERAMRENTALPANPAMLVVLGAVGITGIVLVVSSAVRSITS
jgi:putative membrane protein